jgi:hypothetical protein
VLSAIAALYRNWADKGFPPGQTPFTSYPKWAEVVGGVMVAAGLGDPCLPFEGEYKGWGDLRTEAMTELFRVCRQVRRRLGIEEADLPVRSSSESRDGRF